VGSLWGHFRSETRIAARGTKAETRSRAFSGGFAPAARLVALEVGGSIPLAHPTSPPEYPRAEPFPLPLVRMLRVVGARASRAPLAVRIAAPIDERERPAAPTR